jgi:hypothetical protein
MIGFPRAGFDRPLDRSETPPAEARFTVFHGKPGSLSHSFVRLFIDV